MHVLSATEGAPAHLQLYPPRLLPRVPEVLEALRVREAGTVAWVREARCVQSCGPPTRVRSISLKGVGVGQFYREIPHSRPTFATQTVCVVDVATGEGKVWQNRFPRPTHVLRGQAVERSRRVLRRGRSAGPGGPRGGRDHTGRPRRSGGIEQNERDQHREGQTKDRTAHTLSGCLRRGCRASEFVAATRQE